VASQLLGPKGRVVRVGLAVIDPPLALANVLAIRADLSETSVSKEILDALGGEPCDVLLSDAAPKLTGVKATDWAREEALLESVEALIPLLLRPGGSLILKILEGPEAQAIERRIRGHFDKAKATRPDSSRKGSSERYLVARGYRAPDRGSSR
jgi:23S rRNA (uridine2552-2'-O)-methyltransferase